MPNMRSLCSRMCDWLLAFFMESYCIFILVFFHVLPIAISVFKSNACKYFLQYSVVELLYQVIVIIMGERAIDPNSEHLPFCTLVVTSWWWVSTQNTKSRAFPMTGPHDSQNHLRCGQTMSCSTQISATRAMRIRVCLVDFIVSCNERTYLKPDG